MVSQAPGVQMQLSIASLSMQSMGTASVTVTATPQGGVTVPAAAAGASATITTGLPSGMSANWSAATVTGTGAVTWTLTLKGSPTALASSSTLGVSAQITNASGGAVYSAAQGLPLTVVFTAPTLNFSPAVTHLPVVQGGSATDVFTFTAGGSFHGTVGLAISGLPSGVTALEYRLIHADAFGYHGGSCQLVHLHGHCYRRRALRRLAVYRRDRTVGWSKRSIIAIRRDD
ncbi:MAG: hypothetical protein ABR905_09880 [Terracidiphilus sp.]